MIDFIDTSTRVTKYIVIFCGTREVASVKEEDCWVFIENKMRRGNSKQQGFSTAMIEANKSFNNTF